jgi:hypothetical protein
MTLIQLEMKATFTMANVSPQVNENKSSFIEEIIE